MYLIYFYIYEYIYIYIDVCIYITYIYIYVYIIHLYILYISMKLAYDEYISIEGFIGYILSWASITNVCSHEFSDRVSR